MLSTLVEGPDQFTVGFPGRRQIGLVSFQGLGQLDGLINAIGATLPGASWQRCRTHYARALLSQVPKSAQPWVATLLRTIF